MTQPTFDNLLSAGDVHSSPNSLNDRLAEAASYAVLQRLLPVLRHDVAGALQPIRMLLMVLERRVANAELDREALAKNVASLSSLSKQATADCMNALGWAACSQDLDVSVRSSVDEATQVLALDLSANGLELVNGVADAAIAAPQRFLRTVFMGAVLAFCDQSPPRGSLRITLDPSAHGSRLHLRLMPRESGEEGEEGSSAASLDVVRKYRMIGWADVQAMALAFGAEMVQGEGWLTVELPKA